MEISDLSFLKDPRVLILLGIAVALLAIMFIHYTFLYVKGKSPLQKFYLLVKCSFVPTVGVLHYVIKGGINTTMLLYFLMATLGDLFVHFNYFPIFACGGVTFGLSHLLAAKQFGVDWSHVPKRALAAVLPFVIMHLVYALPQFVGGGIKSACFITYSFVIDFGATCASARLCYYPISSPTWIFCFLGYVFYIISDTVLLKSHMRKDGKRYHYLVMGTYCTAQVLISIGTALDTKP